MTKRSFTTVAIVGTLALTSILSFAQAARPAGQGARLHPISPVHALPISVRAEQKAYNSLTATEGLVQNLYALIIQGQFVYCPAQYAVMAQGTDPLVYAANKLDAASAEYDSQMTLPRNQRDWTNFWLLVHSAYADFQEASGYYSQALETPC